MAATHALQSSLNQSQLDRNTFIVTPDLSPGIGSRVETRFVKSMAILEKGKISQYLLELHHLGNLESFYLVAMFRACNVDDDELMNLLWMENKTLWMQL